ncbi:MAG: hypothetical protein WAU00_14195, partial [Caldilinea sp.]
ALATSRQATRLHRARNESDRHILAGLLLIVRIQAQFRHPFRRIIGIIKKLQQKLWHFRRVNE